MARIKLELPETFLYTYETRVRVTDINYGNHLGNDALLGLLHDARVSFFGENGYSELDLEGRGVIMADVAIQYKGEAFLHETLQISLALDDFNKYGFDIFYRVNAKADGRLIAIAKTGIVCFDYQQRRLTTLPEIARNRLLEAK